MRTVSGGAVTELEADTFALLGLCASRRGHPQGLYDVVRRLDSHPHWPAQSSRTDGAAVPIPVRGVCPACGADRSVTAAGVLRIHYRNGAECPGSRRRPAVWEGR